MTDVQQPCICIMHVSQLFCFLLLLLKTVFMLNFLVLILLTAKLAFTYREGNPSKRALSSKNIAAALLYWIAAVKKKRAAGENFQDLEFDKSDFTIENRP